MDIFLSRKDISMNVFRQYPLVLMLKVRWKQDEVLENVGREKV